MEDNLKCATMFVKIITVCLGANVYVLNMISVKSALGVEWIFGPKQCDQIVEKNLPNFLQTLPKK